MHLLENQLKVKKSIIPGAGKGLFTTKDIEKGSFIVEYTGTITTWKKVEDDFTNVYIYFVNRNYIIDANNHPESLGRYANDASGLSKEKGLRNNTEYVKKNNRIYLKALRNIPAGSELFVSYGKEYWDVMKKNQKLDLIKKEEKGNK